MAGDGDSPCHRGACAVTGLLIAIEGADGVGKGTVIPLVAAALRDRGHDALETAEPSIGPVGVFIRDILERRAAVTRDAMGPLFAADRADHVATIVRPAIAAGRVVLCDRYALSNLVYRAAEATAPLFACRYCDGWFDDVMPVAVVPARPTCANCDALLEFSGSVTQRIRWARDLDVDPLPAMLTVVLTVPRDVATSRMAQRGKPAENYDATSMQTRVVAMYEMAPRLMSNVAMVDAAGVPSVVAASVLAVVLPVVAANMEP